MTPDEFRAELPQECSICGAKGTDATKLAVTVILIDEESNVRKGALCDSCVRLAAEHMAARYPEELERILEEARTRTPLK